MYNKNSMRRGRYSPINNGAYNNTPCKTQSSCDTVTPISVRPSLAMVYSVSQTWRCISDGIEGFDRGTIFDELHKPFSGDKCKNGGGCR